MNTNSVQIDDDEEIDIKEIFRTVYRYRYIILLLVILSTVASSYHAYFKPNAYKASATVEVGLEQRGYGGGQDILAMATESGAMNADTGMDIIKSRFLTEKALKKVNFAHRYSYGYGYYEEEKK